MQALIDLLGIKDLIPHGYCLSWSPILLWLHVVSDLLIALAYYSIPLTIVHFIRQRKDFPYLWLIVMVAAFIVACGTTHLLSAITIWIPVYWLDGLFKGFTAILSVTTAVLMLWIIPRALSLPSAAQLQAEIQQRKIAEEALRDANVALQENVARTQLLLDSALDGIISMDHKGNVIGWNAQAERIFGYSGEQALGREITELIVPAAYRERHRRGVRRFMTPNASNIVGKRLEITGFRADATEFPMELTVGVLRQKDHYFFSAYVRDITERRRAEAAQQEALDRLRKIACQLPGVVFQFRLRPDGNSSLPYASEVLRDIYRIDPEEVRDDAAKVFAVVHPDDLEEHLASIQTSARDLSPWHNEYRLKFVDGTERWLFGNALPQREEDGSVLWHGFVTDITERKRVEMELRESDQKFRQLLQQTPLPLCVCNMAGEITFINNRFEQLFGYTLNDIPMLDEWWLKAYPDVQYRLWVMDHWCSAVERAMRDGTDIEPFEYKVSCKDGAVRIIVFSGLCFTDSFMAVGVDVTERKRMEEQLRENENKLNAILDTVDAYIYIKDCNYQYQYANQPVLRLFGKALEDIIGKSDDAFFDELTADKLHENDRRVIEQGERIATEEINTEKDSAITHAYLSIKQPLRREDGSIYGLCGISTDITERKRMENALRESEYRWKFAVEGSGDGLWDWNVVDSTVFFSKRWKEMLGFNEDEIDNSLDEWVQRIHPDDKSETLSVVRAYFDGKVPVYINEHRVACKDGSWKWILDRGIVVSRDAEGKPLRMIGTHTDITARRQMEEKLRDSDAFNIGILNSLTSHIAVLDAEGVIVAINNAWRRFAKENGLPESRHDMLGFNYLDACKNAVGDEADAAQAGIGAVLAGEQETFHLEYPCHSPDRQRWFHMNVSPLQGSGGGAVVSHENITARKKAEEAIKAASQYVRSLLEASLDPLVTISVEGKITDVNTATEHATGVNRDSLISSDFADYFTEPEKARKGYHQVFSQGFVTDYPLAIRHVSGKITNVLYNASVYRDEQGNVLGVFAAARDITERQQMEDELKASEEKFRSIIEISPVPMALNDQHMNITFLNPAFMQTFGYSVEDIPTLADWWSKAYPDPDYRHWVDTIWQASLGKAKQEQTDFPSLELTIRCKDNSIKTVLATAAAINHDFAGVHLVILYDITERKQIEAELTRSNTELEQFAYAVSHDMRQPLRMVTSYLSLIENALLGQLNEETQQFFDFAVNGAKRMDAMILSLLDYSRVGRKSEAKALISSKASLDEALAFLNPELHACGGEIKVTGDWPELFASRDELTRLLQNLIGNALKYHEQNQVPQVHIHGTVYAESLRVDIRDQGIGIEPSQMDRLFKVFSRLQARSRFDGTGVGLALCRKIVEHHGGTIGVESAGEGQGCVFWFELPIANAVDSE